MGIFSALFGESAKNALIRELLEIRMRKAGYNEMEYRLKIKEISSLELIGTPEGTLVTILETFIKLQRQGILIHEIITRIENHRKKLGSNSSELSRILTVSKMPGMEAGAAVALYCKYRLNTEHPGILSDDEFTNMFALAVQREKALQAPEQQSKQLEIDKQNEIRMKAEDQAKGLGSMQYSTDTADKEEDNQVYEIAEMAIKYRPEVKKAYDDLREYPEEVKFTFLKNMNENPKQNPDDLFKKIIKEYDEKRNPFSLEVTNKAYKSILEIDKKLAQEFINIVNIFGEKNINPNFVKNELIASATLIIEEGVIRSETFKFNYAYKIKNNGVFLIQDEKGNWLEFEGEQAARAKLYIPKFITKTIKS